MNVTDSLKTICYSMTQMKVLLLSYNLPSACDQILESYRQKFVTCFG